MKSKLISQVKVGNPMYGGNFLSRLNGKAVFVPFTLPGELVKISPLVEQKNYTIAELTEVSTPSPNRILPVCPVYGSCGGCHYQHVDPKTQKEIKTAIFTEQLTKIGKLVEPRVLPILSNDAVLGYRNNIQFTPNEKGKLAFVGREPDYPLVEVQNCPIAAPGLNKVASTLEFDPDMMIDRVSIREGSDGIMVILGSELIELPEIAVEGDYSVVHVTEDDSVVIAGNDHILIDVLERSFKVSAGSFFQVNTAMAEVMVKTVLDAADIRPTDTVFDVYCGVGLFSAFIAPLATKLICIEESPSACEDFVVNLDQFDNVELYEADAGEALPNIDQKADVVIIDPPRAGIDKKVLDRIVELSPRKIVYVSCDPSTLARDVSRFTAAGYHLEYAQPLDMFPNTYHIEAVALMIKNASVVD